MTQRGAGLMGTCTLLMAVAFLSSCYRLPVGVKYGINLLLITMAVFSFLARPREEKAAFCLRFIGIYMAAYALAWMWSAVIWIVRLSPPGYVLRGTLNTVYMLTNIGCAGSLFYLLGCRALGCVWAAMAMAHAAVLAEVVLEKGLTPLLGEYAQLLASFAAQTGPVVRRMELHDMVPGWGMLLLFLLMQPLQPAKPGWRRAGRRAGFLLALLFFTMGLKRICVLALAAALPAGALYTRAHERGRRQMMRMFSLLAPCLAFAYLGMIRSGWLFQAARQLHVSLSGREAIFSAYRDFYTLSPLDTGLGVRFIYHYGSTGGGVEALHCELLGMYIELGFFVWPVWLYAISGLRVRLVARAYGSSAARFAFAASVYVLVTFATDNTLYQHPIHVLGCLLSMICCAKEEKGEGRHADFDRAQLSHDVGSGGPVLQHSGDRVGPRAQKKGACMRRGLLVRPFGPARGDPL